MRLTVTIRESDLRERRACGDGMRLYRDVLALQGGVRVTVQLRSGERVTKLRTDRVTLRLCVLAQLWLARDCEHVGWLRDAGLIPTVQAPKANLYGADLRGANLYGANLYGADLRGANLYGADLRGANLYGANLYGADLRGADLRGANLYGADLRGANLYGANLYGADLRGADLYGANLYGADLRGADLRGADLRGANLYGADLRGANLYGADLRGANLRGADLYGANLYGARRSASQSIPEGYVCREGVLFHAETQSAASAEVSQ